MIDPAIDGVFDAFFDMAEIHDHGVGIERADESDVGYPAFAHQTVMLAQIGAIDDGEMFDKQMHAACGSGVQGYAVDVRPLKQVFTDWLGFHCDGALLMQLSKQGDEG